MVSYNRDKQVKRRKKDIINEYSQYVQYIKKYIRNNSIEVKTGRDLENIIRISCNDDTEMTKLLLSCMEIEDLDKEIDLLKLSNKEIIVKQSQTGSEYIDIVNGSRYECGYYNSIFTTNQNKDKCEYLNPYVLISADKIYNMGQLEVYLQKSITDKKPIIIIAPEIDEDVIRVLALNKMNGVLQICLVKAPGFGGTNTLDYLDDLSLLTGATVLRLNSATMLENQDVSYLGSNVYSITIDLGYTTIVSNTDSQIIKSKIDSFDERIREAGNNIVLVTQLKKRKSKLINGLAYIYVFSNSDVEMLERKDRLDDAIGSIKSALQSGYVPGCGTTYINAMKDYIKTTEISSSISGFLEAISHPTYKILLNIFENEEYVKDIVSALIFTDKSNKEKLDYVNNLVDKGVIDPANVIITALDNAFSVASTLFSSSAIILNKDSNV